MLVFEKTRQLARRITFQRALAARGLRLLEPPEPVRYCAMEDVTDDGPFYVLGVVPRLETPAWNESPEPDDASLFDLAALRSAQAQDDQPLYENHESSAQQAWMALRDKQVLEEATREEPDGRQWHVERGRAEGFTYLYCANTFDQRQLVLIEPARAAVLETYYQEITRDIQSSEMGRA